MRSAVMAPDNGGSDPGADGLAGRALVSLQVLEAMFLFTQLGIAALLVGPDIQVAAEFVTGG